jgi:hypothetical protein
MTPVSLFQAVGEHSRVPEIFIRPVCWKLPETRGVIAEQ